MNWLLPLPNENLNPHGFKPRVTHALIITNVIVFLLQVAITGQFFDFSNQNASTMFYNWGAVPVCITGEFSGIDTGNGIIQCSDTPYVSLLSSIFMHGGLMHFGGNMLFLLVFGNNVELKFGKVKYLGLYLIWGIIAALVHIMGDPASVIPAVGASGAISGILGVQLILFNTARLPRPMSMVYFPIKLYVIPFWLIFDNIIPLFAGGFGIVGGGTAFLAHIGGFVMGLTTGYVYKKIRKHYLETKQT